MFRQAGEPCPAVPWRMAGGDMAGSHSSQAPHAQGRGRSSLVAQEAPLPRGSVGTLARPQLGKAALASQFQGASPSRPWGASGTRSQATSPEAASQQRSQAEGAADRAEAVAAPTHMLQGVHGK